MRLLRLFIFLKWTAEHLSYGFDSQKVINDVVDLFSVWAKTRTFENFEQKNKYL